MKTNRPSEPTHAAPVVSMVICTHQRFDLLESAVASLLDQKSPFEFYEVIVVDNDREPNPRVREIAATANASVGTRYVHEPRIGLSHARNAGGRAARAPCVAYMDDDAKAPPEYVSRLVAILDEISPDICGGPYYPFYLNEKPAWYKDAYGSQCLSDEACFLTEGQFLDGGNIILKKALLERLGWFDPRFGMAGKKIGYGEETALQIEAWKEVPRLKVYFDPGLSVSHLVPKRKMSTAWHIKMSFHMGRSQAYLWLPENDRGTARRKAPLRLVRNLLNFPVKHLPGLILRSKDRYPYWQQYVFEVIARESRSLGSNFELMTDLLRGSTSIEKGRN